MRTVRLHGALAKFGKAFKLDVRSAAEAVRALCVQIPGFENHLRTHSAPGYRVHVGKHKSISKDELTLESEGDISIVPVIRGARKALGIILGIVLIVVTWGFGASLGMAASGALWSQATFYGLGVSMILSGVSQLLVKPPQMGGRQEDKSRPSYSLDGPVNTVAQTNPVPVVYGEVIVGSQAISSSLVTEELAIT